MIRNLFCLNFSIKKLLFTLPSICSNAAILLTNTLGSFDFSLLRFIFGLSPRFLLEHSPVFFAAHHQPIPIPFGLLIAAVPPLLVPWLILYGLDGHIAVVEFLPRVLQLALGLYHAAQFAVITLLLPRFADQAQNPFLGVHQIGLVYRILHAGFVLQERIQMVDGFADRTLGTGVHPTGLQRGVYILIVSNFLLVFSYYLLELLFQVQSHVRREAVGQVVFNRVH